MYAVKDGSRTLTFEGNLLGKSSSYRRDSTRWIEFELYRTESGSYVLSRVGVSLVFHSGACELVNKYGLHDVVVDELDADAVPCESCQPTYEAQIVFPEKYRYWAQVSDDPQAVLDALYKRDDNGAKYLTRVAQRLLDVASEEDSAIDEVYHFEFIA